MKTISGIMSHISKKEGLESCRQRYLSRNRAGRSAMIDEIIDAFDWDRKHAIKVLNGKVSHGAKAQRLQAMMEKSQRGGEKRDPNAIKQEDNHTVDPEMQLCDMLQRRVRYFTDGAVSGSRDFVSEAFASARERFSAKRKDGARAMKGTAKEAKGVLWSIKDLQT